MQLNARHATWIAGAVACVVYAHSLANGWAGDDLLVVQRNLRTHSIGAALDAWFLPYWPPPWDKAGLYRPLAILSFAVDWVLSGGRPWVFHLFNVLLHGVATGLVVRISLEWMSATGALVAGLLFAVHPVHVEAVANVVGRSELLAATAVLGLVMIARAYRRCQDDRQAAAWLGASMALLAMGLFSKESAAIGLGAVAVDVALDDRPTRRRSPATLFLALATIIVGWWYLWRGLVAGYVASGATTAFYGLSTGERLSTMLPAQLDVLRLLAWPMELAADYGPLTIPIRREWSGLASLGLMVSGSLVLLGLLVAKRAPVVAFGILVAAGSYLPTSNLLFTSGVVLSERGLYLAALAPAFCLGWGVTEARIRPYLRLTGVALTLILLVFAGRTVARVPFWKNSRGNILQGFIEHPENYRARVYMGDMYATSGDTARALAEYLAAAAFADNDPFSVQFIVRSAVSLKRPRLAIDEARRVQGIAPNDSRPTGWLTESYVAAGLADSAVAVAQLGALAHPSQPDYASNYVWALGRARAPQWRRLLAQATVDLASGRLVQAAARIDSFEPSMRTAVKAPTFCADLVISITLVRLLKPALLDQAAACSLGSSGGLPKPLAK